MGSLDFFSHFSFPIFKKGGEGVGSVVKWRKKKMSKHKHKKLLKKTKHQRRNK